MKSRIKVLGIAAVIVVAVFSVVSCSTLSTLSGLIPANTKLEGEWDRGDITYKVTSDGGVYAFVITSIIPNFEFQDHVDLGYYGVGSVVAKNIKKAGNLRWAGEILNVEKTTTGSDVSYRTSWVNIVITMSEDGKTILFDGRVRYTRIK